MIKLNIKDKEVDISLTYNHPIGSQPTIKIEGRADLSHHLIEGLFDITDKLARMSNCCHRKEEYK